MFIHPEVVARGKVAFHNAFHCHDNAAMMLDDYWSWVRRRLKACVLAFCLLFMVLKPFALIKALNFGTPVDLRELCNQDNRNDTAGTWDHMPSLYCVHFFPLVLCVPISFGDSLAGAKGKGNLRYVLLDPMGTVAFGLGLFAVSRVVYMNIGF